MINSLKRLSDRAGFEYVGEDVGIKTITINSNNIKQNSLFVAIIANRDGHDFIPQAIANGAKALLVSKKQDYNIPQIIFDNTIYGLRKLAKEYRKSLKMPIIALTGSCGKTSVKEMIATLLCDKKIHFTKGNLNNYLGVPITILETSQDVDFAVIEVGTSVGGEIQAAAEIIQPNVAMITNVGASHLENLKTLDGVMIEKYDLLKSLPKDGFCIINLDDERISKYSNSLGCQKITCSFSNTKADIYIKKYDFIEENYDVKLSIFNEEYQYVLPGLGQHNLFNSVMAIAAATAAGVKPESFLKNTYKIKNYKSRFNAEEINEKLILVDDTYNASVLAVKVAIEDLAKFNGKKILVMSSMKELGAHAHTYHKQMGRWLQKTNIDKIFLFGDNKFLKFTVNEIKSSNVKYFETKEDIKRDLKSILKSYSDLKTKITVKGARSYKMEEIVNFVRTLYN